MSKLRPKWMDTPVVARWNKSPSSRGGIPLLRPIDDEEAQAEQLARARELAKAMGFRSQIGDGQAARIAEVLSSHIPGLRCEGPLPGVAVCGVGWRPAKVGRPTIWDEEGMTSVLHAILVIKDTAAQQGERLSDAGAIKQFQAFWRELYQEGGTSFAPPNVRFLQNIVSRARSIPGAWSLPKDPSL